ncbi:IS3 family transposase [Streptomyces sp. NPDC048002]|uniref:IS3 family transposase n=1 Tax=Streptomyces sp. NPDC048002 TaxID=3154344 RepID=UPI0033C6C3FD
MLTTYDCKIAPSTYYAHHKRQTAPAARTVRDAELKTLITQTFEANYRVYGARKIWRHLNRQNVPVARCTVERLMRDLGITGAVRGKKVITTIPNTSAQRAPDLVDRDFVAPAPNRCWVADFTHVTTFAGVVYIAFVVDTFSRRGLARPSHRADPRAAATQEPDGPSGKPGRLPGTRPGAGTTRDLDRNPTAPALTGPPAIRSLQLSSQGEVSAEAVEDQNGTDRPESRRRARATDMHC